MTPAAYLELLDLQEQVREGLEETFPQPVWVKAEIAQIQVRTNGHCYLELSQSDSRGVVAKVKAIIWKWKYGPLSRAFYDATGGVMQQGMTILALCQVSYSELYGLSLNIEDVEPQFTMGEAEMQRRKTIESLEADGLMDRQKELELPLLPCRLAVISAPDAAGYQDFCRHLEQNEYGFRFFVKLFPAAMQGAQAPESITDALALVESSCVKYDAVLIMRGGGSALDLACFDDYGLCLAVANSPLPVLTAIGHQKDYHVADMVAYSFEKTPTALADVFIDAFAAEDERIGSFVQRLRLAAVRRISEMESRVREIESRISAADPRRVLSRGYALVTDSRGVVIKKASDVARGNMVNILFADGQLQAEIK